MVSRENSSVKKRGRNIVLPMYIETKLHRRFVRFQKVDFTLTRNMLAGLFFKYWSNTEYRICGKVERQVKIILLALRQRATDSL